MLNLSSARLRAGTPHADESTKKHNSNSISDALRRRAQAVIKNKAIDTESRAMIRYCLEMDDPWLAELVRRVNAGESIVDTEDVNTADVDTADLHVSEIGEDDSRKDDSKQCDLNQDNRSEEKIEALAEMICQAGDQPAVALLVLMAMFERAAHPKALANLTKHFVFTRCGELNLNGIVDAQITVLEHELLAQ